MIILDKVQKDTRVYSRSFYISYVVVAIFKSHYCFSLPKLRLYLFLLLVSEYLLERLYSEFVSGIGFIAFNVSRGSSISRLFLGTLKYPESSWVINILDELLSLNLGVSLPSSSLSFSTVFSCDYFGFIISVSSLGLLWPLALFFTYGESTSWVLYWLDCI